MCLAVGNRGWSHLFANVNTFVFDAIPSQSQSSMPIKPACELYWTLKLLISLLVGCCCCHSCGQCVASRSEWMMRREIWDDSEKNATNHSKAYNQKYIATDLFVYWFICTQWPCTHTDRIDHALCESTYLVFHQSINQSIWIELNWIAS